MALIVDIRINDRVVDRIAATRIETRPDGINRYRVERADLEQQEVRDLGVVVHDYRDGAARLAAIICAEAARDEARTRLREVCSTWASAGAAPAPAVDRDAVEATLADGLRRGLTIDQLARSVCAAINGEPAPDPVEELAGEIDGAVRDAVRKGFDFIDSVTGIEVDQKVVDAMLTWLPSESRALARRAFGQEADR